MNRKIFILLFFMVLALGASFVWRHRLPEKENAASYLETSSTDDENNEKQTRADLIFLELLEKTLFRSK